MNDGKEGKWETAVKDACTIAGELGWDENDPKGSIQRLIDFHVAVATDPKVNGGFSLQAEAATKVLEDLDKLLNHFAATREHFADDENENVKSTRKNIHDFVVFINENKIFKNIYTDKQKEIAFHKEIKRFLGKRPQGLVMGAFRRVLNISQEG